MTISYFNTSKPFDHIMRFAEGKIQLSSEEQRVFLKAAFDFFTREAFQAHLHKEWSLRLPRKLEKTFFSVALPAFLKTVDCSTEHKQRLLACIKTVTKPYFPKLKAVNEGQTDETIRHLRDTINEINRDGVSATAKIYTNPLKKIKNTEKTAFEALLDSACHQEEDQNTLLELLKYDHAYGRSKLITELTKRLGDPQLIPLFEKIPTEFFLLDEKELENLPPNCLEKQPSRLAKPDLSTLTKEELEQLVRFCINRGKTITECIEHILDHTDHCEAILNNFEKTADTTQKQAINAYWQKKFFLKLDLLCPLKISYKDSFFIWLADNMPITGENCTSLDWSIDKFDSRTLMGRRALRQLHRKLRGDDIVKLAAKRSDLEEIRLKLIIAIEKRMPKLEGERKQERFLALFPNLIAKQPRLEKFFVKWLCVAFRGFGYDKVEKWKQSDELGWSDEIALEVHQAFSNLNNNLSVKEWLPDRVKKRIQKKFTFYCEIPFRTIATAVNCELSKIIPKGKNRDKELSFVRAFLRLMYGGNDKRLLREKSLLVTEFCQLAQAKELDLEGLEWVVKAFERKKIGNHFPVYSDFLKLNPILQETLLGEAIASKLLEKYSSFFQPADHGYLKAILGALFYARGNTVNLKKIVPDYSSMPKESFARIALFCRDKSGIAWMKEHVKEVDLCQSISQSLEITIAEWHGIDCLTHVIEDYLNQSEVTQFREAIQKQGANDIVQRFFKIWLSQLSRSDSSVNKIRGASWTWMIAFEEEDWKSFEKICYDENLMRILTREGLKKTLTTMKDFFPVVYIAQQMDRGLSSMKGFGSQNYEAQQKTLAIWWRHESERKFVYSILKTIFLKNGIKALSQDTLYKLIQKKHVKIDQLEGLITDFKKEEIKKSFAHYGKIEVYQRLLNDLDRILSGFKWN